MDSKGRMAIPARYRDELEKLCASKLVLTQERDGCLLLFPENEWENFSASIMGLANMSLKGRNRGLQRFYVGAARNLDMDAQGRVLVPPSLRKFAGLGKEVVLVGQGVRFELWAKEAWDACTNDMLGDDMDLSGGLEDFSM